MRVFNIPPQYSISRKTEHSGTLRRVFRFHVSDSEPKAVCRKLIALAKRRISGHVPTTPDTHQPSPTRRAIFWPPRGAYRSSGGTPRRPGDAYRGFQMQHGAHIRAEYPVWKCDKEIDDILKQHLATIVIESNINTGWRRGRHKLGCPENTQGLLCFIEMNDLLANYKQMF